MREENFYRPCSEQCPFAPSLCFSAPPGKTVRTIKPQTEEICLVFA